MILPFFLAFVALVVLTAVLDYQSTRTVAPTHPHVDLLMRERAARLRNAERDNSTQRGERCRDASDLLNSFDPSFYTTKVSN